MPGKKDPEYLENLPPTQIVHSLTTSPTSPTMASTNSSSSLHHNYCYPPLDEVEVDRLVTSIREQLGMGPKFHNRWGTTAAVEEKSSSSYNSCIHSPKWSQSSRTNSRNHPYNSNLRRRRPTNSNSQNSNNSNSNSISNCSTSELAALQALLDSRSLIKEAVRRLQDHTRRQLQDSKTPLNPDSIDSELSPASSWSAINTL